MTIRLIEKKTNENQQPCFKFKGSSIAVTIFQLLDSNLSKLIEQIALYVSTVPKFFDNTPVIIDCQIIADNPGVIDLVHLIGILRQYKMIPIGLRGGRPELQQLALKIGLALFQSSKQDDRTQVPKEIFQPEPLKIPVKTKIITQTVRSGQQVYAKGSDLIILGAVSAGAECLADGNIHVYGTLRGRALAGILGDTNAHIFCKNLEAELVSVAGQYQVSETLKEGIWATAADVFLRDGNLQIISL